MGYRSASQKAKEISKLRKVKADGRDTESSESLEEEAVGIEFSRNNPPKSKTPISPQKIHGSWRK